jgi:hypothetical protein
VLTDARACPWATCWPTFTSIEVTAPETSKFKPAWLAGSIVPDVATVCLIVPVVAFTTVVVISRPFAGGLPVSQSPSPLEIAARMITTSTIRRVRFRRHDFGVAGSVSRSSPEVSRSSCGGGAVPTFDMGLFDRAAFGVPCTYPVKVLLAVVLRRASYIDRSRPLRANHCINDLLPLRNYRGGSPETHGRLAGTSTRLAAPMPS